MSPRAEGEVVVMLSRGGAPSPPLPSSHQWGRERSRLERPGYWLIAGSAAVVSPGPLHR